MLVIIKSAALKLSGMQRSIQALYKSCREQMPAKQIREWLEEQRKNSVNVHLSIEFTGINPPRLDRIKQCQECMIERDITLWLSPELGADPNLKINQKAYIGRNTYIGVFQPITIGKYTQIGAYSYIIFANHCYETREIPIIEQGFVGAPIGMEEEVWLGTHVVVLPGVFDCLVLIVWSMFISKAHRISLAKLRLPEIFKVLIANYLSPVIKVVVEPKTL